MATKRKTAQPWWRKRRVQRRLAVLGAMVLVVVVFAWLVVRGEGSGSGSGQYLREPAPPFPLPTVAEGQVSLADHVGRHNTLLYFSEGIGCAPCFDQIVDLEADWDRFAALNVELVSVMIDPMEDLKAEIARRGITGIVAAGGGKGLARWSGAGTGWATESRCTWRSTTCTRTYRPGCRRRGPDATAAPDLTAPALNWLPHLGIEGRTTAPCG